MDWNKKDIVNICKIVAFGIILYWFLNNLALLVGFFKTICGILSPFIAGAAIAFVVNIPMTIFEVKIFKSKNKRKETNNQVVKVSKIKRLISIVISLILITLLIIGIVFLVIPELINVIGQIVSYLPDLLVDIKDIIKKLSIDYPQVEDVLNNFQANLESFNTETIKELTTFGTSLVTSSFGVITSTVSFVLQTVVAIIFSIYILMGKEKMVWHLKRLLYAVANKNVADEVSKLANMSKEAFNNFITGQFTECIILGSLCAIGMVILRLPYSATVGALVAVTAFIPIVGAMIGGVIGIVLLLPISLGKAITFLIFFTVLQQTENNLIYPKVVGSSVGVPGALVLIAITIGSALAGAIGMVISLPITSVLYTLLCEFTEKRLQDKGLEEK